MCLKVSCMHIKNMNTIGLPRSKLFNMIVDGHWERPKQLAAYDRRRKCLEKKLLSDPPYIMI
jgi:hypothetical protein